MRHRLAQLTYSGCLLAMTAMVPGAAVRPAEEPQPPARQMNILWIISDDHGPELGAYGTPGLETPNLDRLAARGMKFTNAHTTSPICSPSRSAFMTGMYQTSINAHHHRSNRDKPLEGDIRPVTKLFREAGWFTANDDGAGNPGKTDLNFKHGPLFDGVSWREREPGQPFFAQVNFFQPHRPFVKAQVNPVDADTLTLPPYYPDEAILREDLAQYYDSIHLLDRRVGGLLDQLEADGLADDTIIIFFGDNGRPFARDKQFLYTGGTHVPLIISIPGGEEGVRDDLVSMIDVTAQTLAFANLDVPDWMEGRPFLEPGIEPREYLYSARDRGDETEDRIRAVRNHDYNYIRNFHPGRPYLQFNAYKQLSYPDWRLFVGMADEKGDDADFLFLHSTRPTEELYDLRHDPHELNNLADDPEYREILVKFRQLLDDWMEETGDRGGDPEDPEFLEQVRSEMRAWYEATPEMGPENPIPWDDGK